ncbi:MAG: DUF4215 domain-containing protein, partial [Polyangia bacterium]|nr:DUF4215 domain-containing protein [Polyangia bacterium]
MNPERFQTSCPLGRRLSAGLLALFLVQAGCGDDDSAGNNNTNSNSNGNAATCGDGRTEGIEECDEGSANSDSVPDACRTDCRLARCGDGVVDTGEACDEGAFNASVPNTCRPSCELPACGDGIVDTEQGETCDDGNLEPGDGCSPDCGVEYCGNGVVDAELGEVCDDGNFVPGDGCSPDCRVPCGNGLLDHPEERCDGAPPAGETCLDYGFDGGALGCSYLCLPDFGGCTLLGWRTVPGDYTYRLDALWTHESGFGVAVGVGGAIHQFDGVAWRALSSPVTAWLKDVWGSAPDDVWAVGDGGTLLHWDGQAWSQLTPPPTSADLTAVSGSAPDDVWVAVHQGPFLHFDGALWTEHAAASTSMNALAVLGPTEAWAVGVGDQAWRWNGTAWAAVQLPAYASFNALYASGPTDLWAVGSSGKIIHWDGLTWRQVPSGISTDIKGVWGTGPDDVWMVAGEYNPRMLHFDGRQILEHPLPAGLAGMRDLHASGHGQVWAVGNDGQVIRFHGRGWHQQPASEPILSFTSDPQGGLFAKAGEETTPELWRFDGAAWTLIGPIYRFASLWSSVPGEVWATALNSLEHWDASGLVAVPSPIPLGVAVLDGREPDDFWVAGQGTQMAHYDGLSLTAVPFAAEEHSVTALFVDPLGRPLAASYNVSSTPYVPSLIRFDGASWIVEPNPLQRMIRGIWGAAADDLWAVGESGALLRFDGLTWTAHVSPVNMDLRAIHGTGASDVWVGGVGGWIMRFGGTLWSPVRAPFTSNVRGIRATPREVWALGSDGQLWRLLRNVPFDCAATESCGDGVDNDCNGLADGQDPACSGCADGTAEQVFARGMVGCAGLVSFANRATLCASGYRPCSAEQWVRLHGRAGPAYSYWTDDDLRWNGLADSCRVSTTQ